MAVVGYGRRVILCHMPVGLLITVPPWVSREVPDRFGVCHGVTKAGPFELYDARISFPCLFRN